MIISTSRIGIVSRGGLAGASVLFFLTLAARDASAAAGGNQETAKLLASGAVAGQQFGAAVAISGSNAIVGAPMDNQGGMQYGAAYIFHNNGTSWTQQQKLVPTGGAISDRSGASVAIDGNVAVVGGYYPDTPASDTYVAYVFRNNGSSWVQEQELLPSNATYTSGDRKFGFAVAVSGNVVAVSDKGDGTIGVYQPTVYLFRYQGTGWTPQQPWVQEQQIISPTSSTWSTDFGRSVALSGDNLIIGELRCGGTSLGRAHIYQYNHTTLIWGYKQVLQPASLPLSSNFGWSVSLDGNLAAVGAKADTYNGVATGTAYIYRYNSTTASWVQEAKLSGSDCVANSNFGSAVSVRRDPLLGSNDVALIGKTSGGAYLFRPNGSTWTETSKVIPSAVNTLVGGFGLATALSGDVAFIGAPYSSEAGTYSGAAYVYSVASIIANPYDPQPPTVSITSPANMATVSGTITIQAAASDNVGVTHVDLYVGNFNYVNGTWVYTLLASIPSAPYTYSLDTATLTNDYHGIKAIAFDAYGNNSTALISVTVSNTATTFTITATAGTGGTITPSGNVTVNQGGSQSFSISAGVGYQIGDVTVDGVSQGPLLSFTFGNVQANHTISASFISGTDTTPDPFSFVDQTGVALNTVITSNIVAITGIGAPTPISVVGGSYSINGGAYTTLAGTIINSSSTVTVRHTSAATNSTSVNTTLTVGGVSDTFTSTTLAATDTTPDPFSFVDQTGVALNTVITSNTVTITGINAATAISVVGGSYSINGGAYTTAAGTITNNSTVTVRHTSAATNSTAVNTTLTVDGISDTFTSTTLAATDTTPDPFSFVDQTGVALNTVITSNTVTITGINAAAAISVAGGSYSINGGAYTTAAGTITNNSTVTVRHTSAATNSTAVNTTLTIGGVSDTFTSTTLAASDTTPDPFSFVDQTGVALNTVITSNTVTITGINAAAAISVVGGSYSINGGAYTTAAGTITNNSTVTVRHTSAATSSTSVNTTLTIGGVSDTFTSTTLAASDTTPDPFSFVDQTGVALNTVITSNAVTITGINAAAAISVVGGSYSINGGAYTTAAGTITNNSTVTVRHTSAATNNTSVNTTLTIGGVSDTFTSTTLAASDATPDPFSFVDQTGVALNTVITSNAVTITGINAAAAISVAGGSYSINGGAYTTAAGTITNNSTVAVRHTSAATNSTAVSTTLTVGGVSDTFTSTTVAPITFPITVGFGTGGTITPNTNSGGTLSDVNVAQGTNQTFTITANAGYTINNVSVDSVSQGTLTSYTFSNVQTNHKITAGFTLVTDTTPDPFSFVDQTGVALNTVITSNTITITGISAAAAISVVGGSYSINGGAYTTSAGTITNNSTVAVRHTSAATNSTAVNTTLTVGGVSDTFTSTTLPAPNTFNITASAGTGGTITPSGSVTVNQGANQAFTIAANAGYQIQSVTVDSVNQGALSSYTFSNVQANHTISASFVLVTYTITATAGSGGTITPSGSVTVNQGASQAFTIAANSGYHIASVTVDSVNQGALTSYTFSNVQTNHTISASFAVNTFTIAATAGTGGTITPSGNVTVNQGANQAFTIAANAGYQIQSVTVDSVSQGALSSYTFSNVQANHTISASFVATYTIAATAGSGGTITPSGSVTVNQGASQAFTIAANSGYHIASVTVDSVNQGALSSYTFSTVQANHSISASFAVNTFTITATAGTGGTITPSGSVTVNQGANQAFTIAANAGYQIASVTVDTVNQGALTSYTFSNVQADHTISASFIQISDTTPDPFSFVDQTGVALNTVIISNTVTITGINAAAAISVVGGSYSINGGAYTTAAGTITNNSTVAVSHTSAATNGTAVNTTLTIGGVSDTFTSTTLAGTDTTPNPFSFVDQTGVALSTVITSNAVTITGINAAAPISVTGGSYSINSGAYTTAAGTITNNSTVTVRHTSAATNSTSVNTTLTVGGVSDTFTSTTVAASNTYIITATAGTGGSMTPSGNVVVSKNADKTFNIAANAGNQIQSVTVDGANQGALSTYTFNNVRKNHTIIASFVVLSDTTPDPFTFVDQTGVALNTVITSNTITITGISAAAAISVTGGSYSINGGAYTTAAGTITNNSSVSVRHTSAATNGTAVNTTLTVGGVSDTFTSTTVAGSDTTPDPFSFVDQTGVALNTVITSNTVTITGINAAAAISVTGGSYSINGGAYTTAAGTITNNSTVAVRHTSAATNSTSVNTTLTVGGVSDTFTSTTLASADTTPDPFSFVDQTGVALNTVITSNVVTITGINAAAAISVVGGSYSINGGAYTTAAGTITNNSTVTVRHTSAATNSTSVNTTLTVGGISDIFTSTTLPAPNTFNITATAGTGGTITPSGNVVVNQGASQAFTIAANSGYHIAGVTVDGVNQGALTSYTFSNVQANHTISASFAVNTFTIAATAGTGGTITPGGSVTVNQGANQAFTIAANAGYQIQSVTVDGINQGAIASYTFSNVQANHTISASFVVVTYTISATAGTGGTITPSGSVTVNQGANQVFSIAANTGYQIQSVTVDGVNQGAVTSYTFSNVQANHAISANFAVITYTITATAGSGGTITPSGSITVSYGNNQAFSIAPNAGYQVSSVTVDGVNQGVLTSYTFPNVQANHTISASFSIITYTITATAGTGGTITPAGSVAVNYGASQAFSIAPNAGYQVTSVTVDGVNQGVLTSYTFPNVQANHTISASFSIITYTITATAGTGGTITPGGNVTVNNGASQVFTVAANANYEILSVTVDGINQGALTSYTFPNVQANHTISASFSPLYTLSTTAINGTITRSPNQTNYSSGTVVTLTATANTGYVFTGWSGDLTGSTNPITITMNSNKTVSANFGPAITITSPANNSDVSGTTNVLVTTSASIVVKVELYVDTVLVDSSTVAPFTIKWNASSVPKGAHTLLCKAYDAAGNVGSSPVVNVTAK